MKDSQDWEQRYQAVDRLFDDEASDLLQSNESLLQPGMQALALGDGEGRNGVWLAGRRLDVMSVDISPTALARAQSRARQQGVSLQTRCADILTWQWPVSAYDLITCIFVHLPGTDRRLLHRRLQGALKPRGLVMIEGFHRRQLQRDSGGPRDADLLYDEDSLTEDFAGYDILLLEQRETEVRLAGQYQGHGCVIHFIARAGDEPRRQR